jgi:uncharacterized protein YbjQ (UPF0145 family)
MAETVGGELPEAATHRLAGGAWSSGLSVADFASCLDMGMEPVGYVQGYAVLQWNWFMATGRFGVGLGGGLAGMGAGRGSTSQRRGQYVEQWQCPHGFVSAEHRMYGANYELTWLEESWATGWGLATGRMVDEAKELGATGVVGVVDAMRSLIGGTTVEFRASGTAVVVPEAPRPVTPFSTYLSGQRLAKLIEAGFAPVAVVATLSAVRMLGYCITHYQLAGSTSGSWYGAGAGGVSGVGPVDQVNRAQAAARHLARERVRAQLGADILHGATLESSEREIGEGDLSIQCTLKGTRVRRFKEFDPLPDATPVVRLV